MARTMTAGGLVARQTRAGQWMVGPIAIEDWGDGWYLRTFDGAEAIGPFRSATAALAAHAYAIGEEARYENARR